jgi:hypothetical protein
MKKKIAKQLGQIAETLPTVTMLTHEKHLMKGEDMIINGQTELKDGKPIIAGKAYINPMPVIMEVNHKRRMKKLYKKFGPGVIPNYIKAVENHVNAKQAQ